MKAEFSLIIELPTLVSGNIYKFSQYIDFQGIMLFKT